MLQSAVLDELRARIAWIRGYVAEVDGRRLGINRNIHDDLHPWEYNLHRHLERVVLGHARVARSDGFAGMTPQLSPLQAALLRHDGFSPLGVSAVAWTIGRVALDAGERRHVIKAWSRHSRQDRLGRTGWEQMQIDLGQGVVVGEKGIVIRTRLPDTIVDTLTGRRADAVIGHPVLHDFVITSVSTRRKGHTLIVAPVELAPKSPASRGREAVPSGGAIALAHGRRHLPRPSPARPDGTYADWCATAFERAERDG